MVLRCFLLCFYWKPNALLTANTLISLNMSPLLLAAALCCLAIQASLHCNFVLPITQHCHQHWCTAWYTKNARADCFFVYFSHSQTCVFLLLFVMEYPFWFAVYKLIPNWLESTEIQFCYPNSFQNILDKAVNTISENLSSLLVTIGK